MTHQLLDRIKHSNIPPVVCVIAIIAVIAIASAHDSLGPFGSTIHVDR